MSAFRAGEIPAEAVAELRRKLTGLEELPPLSWVRRELRGGFVRYRRPVIKAYLVGSRARLDRAHREDSDVDIAVVVAPVRGKRSIRLSENFHSRYTAEHQKPTHEGKPVDFQFFYPGELEELNYDCIELPEG